MSIHTIIVWSLLYHKKPSNTATPNNHQQSKIIKRRYYKFHLLFTFYFSKQYHQNTNELKLGISAKDTKRSLLSMLPKELKIELWLSLITSFPWPKLPNHIYWKKKRKKDVIHKTFGFWRECEFDSLTFNLNK